MKKKITIKNLDNDFYNWAYETREKYPELETLIFDTDHGLEIQNMWKDQQAKIDQLVKDKQELIECCKSIKEGQQPYENESGYIKISLHKYAIPAIEELLK